MFRPLGRPSGHALLCSALAFALALLLLCSALLLYIYLYIYIYIIPQTSVALGVLAVLLED